MSRYLIVSAGFPTGNPAGGNTVAAARYFRLRRRGVDVQWAAFGNGADATQISLGASGGSLMAYLRCWWRLLWLVADPRIGRVEFHNIPVALGVIWLIPFLPAVYFFHGPAAAEAEAEGKSGWRVTCAGLIEFVFVAMCKRLYYISPSFFIDHIAPRRTYRQRARFRRIRLPLQAVPTFASCTSHYMIACRRLVRRTGVDLLVRAFAKATKLGLPDQAELCIVGDGPHRTCIQVLIEQLGLGDRVRLVGRVSDDQRDQLLRNARFNVVPSLQLEGFGMILLEAAFLGVPSVATRVGYMPSVMQRLGLAAYLCEPQETDLAEALVRTWHEPPVRGQVQSRAIEAFAYRYAPPAPVAQAQAA